MTRQALIDAMEAAEDAFKEELEEQGFDPAYFDLKLKGVRLSSNFKPYRKEIEFSYTHEVELSEKDD